MRKQNFLFVSFVVIILSLISCSSNVSGVDVSSQSSNDSKVIYTITFKPNNTKATGTTSIVRGESDSTVVLTANGFSLSGYLFTGWNTAKDGSGTGYADKASVNLTSDLTLYAQWVEAKIQTYNIIINEVDEGSITASATVSVPGQEIRIVVRQDEYHYIEALSVTGTDGTEILVTPKTSSYKYDKVYSFLMPEQNVNITASFKPYIYTITFDSNNSAAVGMTAAVSGEAGTVVNCTANAFIYRGFKFTGWNTKRDGSGTGYANEAGVKLTGNITLYAQWILDVIPTYSINVLPIENGTVTVSQSIAEAGTEINLTLIPSEFYAVDTISVYEINGIEITVIASQNQTGKYTFIMQENDVTVSVTYRYVACRISVADTLNGTVSVNKNISNPNEEILVTFRPNEAYEVDRISVIDSNEREIFISEKNKTSCKFRVAEDDVTVHVTYKRYGYYAIVSPDINGSVYLTSQDAIPSKNMDGTIIRNKNIIKAGQAVQLKISPNSGYILKAISVSLLNQSLVPVTKNNENTFSFIMPEGDLSINVEFVQGYTVTFDTGCSTTVEPQSIVKGGKAVYVSVPDNSEREGFINWYTELECKNIYNFDKEITENITLYAKWETFIINETITWIHDREKYVFFSDHFKYSCTVRITGNCYGLDDFLEKDNKSINLEIEHSKNLRECGSVRSVKISGVGTDVEIRDFRNLQSVIIESSTCNYRFNDCRALTSVNWSCKPETIPMNAFNNCTSLTQITIPDSVREIGNEAFSGCADLTQVMIPDSVIKIGERVFSGCTGLTQVVIPDGVKEIGNEAFYGCTGLTQVVIPDSVREIGERAFLGCTSLTQVVIPDGVIEIGDETFSGCENLTQVTIPDSVSEIGKRAFFGCKKLTQIRIPDNVNVINDGTFEDCTSLEEVINSDKITYIKIFAFRGCTSLKRFTMSGTYIGARSFENCSSLREFNFSDNVEITDDIGLKNLAFSGCSSLEEFIFPDGMKINDAFSGFDNCIKLKKVVLPKDLVSFNHYGMFYNCKALKTITLPASVKSFDNKVFRGYEGGVSFEDKDAEWIVIKKYKYEDNTTSLTLKASQEGEISRLIIEYNRPEYDVGYEIVWKNKTLLGL